MTEIYTLQKLEAFALYLDNFMNTIEELRLRAVELDRMDTVVDINTTIKGVFRIAKFISEQHKELLEMTEAIKVPILNLDAPKRHLTLVVDNTTP